MNGASKRRKLRNRLAVAREQAQHMARLAFGELDSAIALVGQPLTFIRRVFFDSMAEVVEQAGPPSCRGPGCSGCCHGPIAVLPIEVERLRAVASPTVRERARAMAALSPIVQRDAPCPALNPTSRTCSIYDERPLVCRIHASWGDPKRCEPGGPGAVSVPHLGAQYLALAGVMGGVQIALHDVLSVEVPDAE